MSGQSRGIFGEIGCTTVRRGCADPNDEGSRAEDRQWPSKQDVWGNVRWCAAKGVVCHGLWPFANVLVRASCQTFFLQQRISRGRPYSTSSLCADSHLQVGFVNTVSLETLLKVKPSRYLFSPVNFRRLAPQKDEYQEGPGSPINCQDTAPHGIAAEFAALAQQLPRHFRHDTLEPPLSMA